MNLSELRWRILKAVAPRRTVRSRGLQFTLQCENVMTYYRWRTYNSKEPETLDWIDTAIRDGEIFLDIGANIGLYTLYAALRHPHTCVIAFEPEYANAHLLRDNVLKNRLEKHVTIYSVALSNRSGLGWLHIQDTIPGSALHTESPQPLDRTRAQRPVIWREGVWTLPLDTFCQQVGVAPHAIKLDVDGTESEILEGGAQTLRSKTLRSILLEVPLEQPARERCERLLSEAGLVCTWRDPLQRSPNEIWEREKTV